MKVLITTGIFPPDIGGPARMVEQLAKDLTLKGLKITVLAFGKEDGQNRSYQVIKILSKLKFLWQLFRLSKRTDIIYTFDLYTAGFFSWLISLIRNKKLVIRFAGDSAWESAQNKKLIIDDLVTFQNKNYGFKIAWSKMFRSWILRGADKVVAVSNFMKEVAKKIGMTEEKIKVIYNSVGFVDLKNLETETLKVRQELGLGDSKIMVTAGRLVPWKGIEGVISVSKVLALKLLIIGDGPSRKNLEKLANENVLGKEVFFLGNVPLDKIFAYYNLADVFVLNSQYEGLSHVLLEVLRLGKPIVASNCGGNPEVIENEKNGLLVEYNNANQLSLAIKTILSEPYWQSNAHKTACEESLRKFNWENVVNQTIQVFEEIKK